MDQFKHNGDPRFSGNNGGAGPSHHPHLHDGELSDRPLKGLVTEMVEQGRRLMRAELRLARSELSAEAKKAARGSGMAAAGAGLLVLGAFTLVAFLVLALAQLMPAWAAALLVTVALLGGGAAVGWAGVQRLKHVHAPTRTLDTLKEDGRWAKETMRSAQSQMHGHA